MTAADVGFREKYLEWVNSHDGSTPFAETPESIEEWYAAKHPPKVTAEDVLREFNAILGTPPYRTVPAYVERMAYEIRDLRNAAREAPDDEAWMVDAAERLDRCIDGQFGRPGGFVANCLDVIRHAYVNRARAKK